MNIKKLFLLLFVGLSLIFSSSKAWDENSFNDYQSTDIKAKSFNGRTPLHDASQVDNLELIELLIGQGADINAQDYNGRTSLHCASQKGNLKSINLLIDAGAKIDAKDYNGRSSLHYASQAGNLESIRLLIEQGADIDAKDNSGWTSLHYASQKGHVDAIRLLFENGADIKAIDCYGKTLLHVAAKKGRKDVTKFLLDARVHVNAVDNNGGTPVHNAAIKGNVNVIQLLIDAGADTNALNSYKNSPLFLATKNKKKEAAALLLTTPVVLYYSNEEKQKKATNLKGVTSLRDLASNFLTKKYQDYNDDSKKEILRWVLKVKWNHKDSLLFDDILIKYAKNLNFFNAFLEAEQNELMNIIKSRHLLIMQQMIMLKNKNEETALGIAQEKDQNKLIKYFNQILNINNFDDMDDDLKKSIDQNYKKFLTSNNFMVQV